jgi:hypothetical protein
MVSNMPVLSLSGRILVADASYQHRQDTRELAQKQHLIGTVGMILAVHAADKGSYQQRLLTVNFDIKLLIFR